MSPLQVGIASLVALVTGIVVWAIRRGLARGPARSDAGSGDVSPGATDAASCGDSSAGSCGGGGD